MTVFENGELVIFKDHDADVLLPIGSGNLKKFSYMDKRTLHICRQLKLKNAGFYVCMEDGYTYRFLKGFRMKHHKEIEEIAAELAKASELDCLQHNAYSGFILEAEKQDGDVLERINLVVKSPSASRLTALTAAAAAILSLDDHNELGIYNMSTMPNVESLPDQMAEMDPLFFYKIYKGREIYSMNVFEGDI